MAEKQQQKINECRFTKSLMAAFIFIPKKEYKR